jgi:hypothetical protein
MPKLTARVKQSVPFNMIQAFGGFEYVKYEFRRVPDDPKIQEQAKAHEYLEFSEKALEPVVEKPAVVKAKSVKKTAGKPAVIEEETELDPEDL